MTDIERYIEKAATVLPLDVSRHESWSIRQAAIEDRRRQAHAVLAAILPDIRRDVSEEIREAIARAADAVIPSGEYAHGATNGLIQAAIIARTVGTGREES